MTRFGVLIAILLIWCGFATFVSTLPWYFPPTPLDTNVAAILGYNIELAFLLIAGWSLFSIVAVALAFRVFARDTARAVVPDVSLTRPGQRLAELAFVAIVSGIFYWPWALARLGPKLEDGYFLNVLWRISCGASPYTDFEFLYGPLMIQPLVAWIKFVGFSAPAYYAAYGLAQITLLLVVVTIVQNFVSGKIKRYLVFLMLAPFIVDLLYGFNWIAWRYFGVVLVLLLLSRRPEALGTLALAALITGLQAAYSYEYGIATLLAGITAIGIGFFYDNRTGVMLGVALFIAGSVIAWMLVALALTGDSFGDYIGSTVLIAETASAEGLGRFAFYLTGHSLALFLLLSAALSVSGLALARIFSHPAAPGDRYLAGALVFALVTLKIALQRVDFLHLAVPFVPLMLAFLLDMPRTLSSAPRLVNSVSMAAIIAASIAHAVAYMPWATWVVKDAAAGWLHIISGRPTSEDIEARRQTISKDRSYMLPLHANLAARLVAPEYAEEPVFFYRQLWDLPPLVGVCPEGYAFYDLLYSDPRSPHAELIQSTPDLVVVMHVSDWEDLNSEPQPLLRSLEKIHGLTRIAQLVGSPHFAQSPIENTEIESRIWREAVGQLIAEIYVPEDEVGPFLLLRRKKD